MARRSEVKGTGYLEMKSILKQLFLNSVSFVRTNTLVESALRIKNGELVVGAKTYPLMKNYYCVGFGKAVVGMARQVEKMLNENLVQGILSVPIGSGKLANRRDGLFLSDESRFAVYEGAVNNLPDEKALEAAQKIINLVKSLGKDDILLVLISGGGSALLPLPTPPITLDEKTETIKLLASRGATITELNGVRQNLSETKGGKLAAQAYPAQIISLILSDIINDPIDFIASGPTATPQCSCEEAISILRKYSVYEQTPESVITTLSKSVKIPIDMSHVQNVIIGNNKVALEGTFRSARSYFEVVKILSNTVEGLVDNVSSFYVQFVKLVCLHYVDRITNEEFTFMSSELAKTYNIFFYDNQDILNQITVFRESSQKEIERLCLLIGGETTVHVKGSGMGGRNQELALNFGLKLSELVSTEDWMSTFNVWFLSAGTDGMDGPTDAAGAITHNSQMRQAEEQGLDARKFLENNDSYTFYSKLNNGEYLVKSGLTGTNVMDIHILMIEFNKYP